MDWVWVGMLGVLPLSVLDEAGPIAGHVVGNLKPLFALYIDTVALQCEKYGRVKGITARWESPYRTGLA